jgi:hypothetical protein
MSILLPWFAVAMSRMSTWFNAPPGGPLADMTDDDIDHFI